MKLYNADCLEVMRDMPDKSVDLIVTDCPYKIVQGGSGSTGVAARNLHRDFIGIEIDEKYYKIARDRIEGEQQERFEI